jgi:ribonuclease HII
LPDQLFNTLDENNPDGFYSREHPFLCGIDEVGRGAFSGPVVSVAAMLKKDVSISDLPDELTDSKLLSSKKRIGLSTSLFELCDIGIGIIPPDFIDNINILNATMQAMQIAYKRLLDQLPPLPKDQMLFALIDGNRVPYPLEKHSVAIIKGDKKSKIISAASVVAKVFRDDIMVDLANANPVYSWENNKGYGTNAHINAIKKYGSSNHHRKTFLRKIAD